MPKITSWKSPKVEVSSSGIEGEGLFAKDNIKKGELIFCKSGHIVNEKEAREYENKLGEYGLTLLHNLWLSPTTEDEITDIAIHINHSCEPNVGPDGQVTFVTLRDIKAGEELTYDYAMTTDYEYKLQCECGSRLCRKVITGNDWKRKDLQERYGIHFSWYILKQIKGW